MRHGVLEASVAFLQKPFDPVDLAAKVRSDAKADCGPIPGGRIHRGFSLKTV